MSTFSEKIFGPLTKEYCQYFLVFSVVGFTFMVLSSIFMVALIVMSGKKQNYGLLLNVFTLFISSLITYFSNRLLYTMCNNATARVPA